MPVALSSRGDEPLVLEAVASAPAPNCVVPRGYRLSETGLFKVTRSQQGVERLVPIAPAPVVIVARHKNIHDNSEHLELERTRQLPRGLPEQQPGRDSAHQVDPPPRLAAPIALASALGRWPEKRSLRVARIRAD